MHLWQLERLELAFDSVKKQLFGQLHNVLRHQLFDATELKASAANGTSTPAVQIVAPLKRLTAVSSNPSLVPQK